MTRRNRAKSSSLFLLELILAILFFSIASAVCVQFFVKSHLLSRDAKELNSSVTEVSSIAELISVSDDLPSVIEMIQSEYPDADVSDVTELLIYYDSHFLPCSKKEAQYCLYAEFIQDGSMLTGNLDMMELKTKDSIYSFDITHHLQRRVGDGN